MHLRVLFCCAHYDRIVTVREVSTDIDHNLSLFGRPVTQRIVYVHNVSYKLELSTLPKMLANQEAGEQNLNLLASQT